jgi:hypothetical protein
MRAASEPNNPIFTPIGGVVFPPLGGEIANVNTTVCIVLTERRHTMKKR